MKKALVLSLVFGSALGVAHAAGVEWVEGGVTGSWSSLINNLGRQFR